MSNLNNMKLCTGCREYKILAQFNKCKKAKDGLKHQCKKCRNTYLKQWGVKNPLKKREQKYKTRYGISIQDYNNILIKQNNSCAICKSTSPKIGSYFVVDHCHVTGKNRSLLCRNCNSALGLFEENTIFLQKAIEYIEKFAAEDNK